MSYGINETHDPQLQSWVEAANDPHTDFPLQNLPFGLFTRKEKREVPQLGVAIGDAILNLTACTEAGLLNEFRYSSSWYPSASFVPQQNQRLRRRVSELLAQDNQEIRSRSPRLQAKLLIPQQDVEMLLPMQIGDYTDFYCNVHHATNVGSMFRPDNPLLPNYKHVPIGYHGRASSIVVSRTNIRRPCGQTAGNDNQPTFGPSQQLDYELEVGAFVARGNELGAPIAITEAEKHLFGLCLVNDWSARDVQRWEYQPLGPFLAKSFATTISPWIVTMEALAPFRVPAAARAAADPRPLPYLSSDANETQGGIALQLEVWLSSAQMREQQLPPLQLSHSNFREMYWTFAQMLTHHASNGCNLRAGDLLASGTVSGPTKDARGCLLELTWRGTEPIPLPSGEQRTFLQDGDEVILRGYCERDGFRRIGFGECRGLILPVAEHHE
ncbi:MAG: fumarylacetoacetase [Blastocatellia bacterium]